MSWIICLYSHTSNSTSLRAAGWLYIDPVNVKRISPSIASQYARTFLKGGEIVVTVRGTLGGVAVVPLQMKGFNVSREVTVVPLLPDLNAQFFCYAMGAIWSQNWLSEVTKGVAYSGVNIKDLKRLPLPVPPLAEQAEIVRRVESLFRLADEIEARVVGGAARADRVTQAVLAKAFRGELVPTEAELARRGTREATSALQHDLQSVIREASSSSDSAEVPMPVNPPDKSTSVEPPTPANQAIPSLLDAGVLLALGIGYVYVIAYRYEAAFLTAHGLPSTLVRLDTRLARDQQALPIRTVTICTSWCLRALVFDPRVPGCPRADRARSLYHAGAMDWKRV